MVEVLALAKELLSTVISRRYTFSARSLAHFARRRRLQLRACAGMRQRVRLSAALRELHGVVIADDRGRFWRLSVSSHEPVSVSAEVIGWESEEVGAGEGGVQAASC